MTKEFSTAHCYGLTDLIDDTEHAFTDVIPLKNDKYVDQISKPSRNVHRFVLKTDDGFTGGQRMDWTTGFPTLAAVIMSRASSPRTSPMMTRSGRMRRLFLTQLARLNVSSLSRREQLSSKKGIQFKRVFDNDHAVGHRNKAQQRIEQKWFYRYLCGQMTMLAGRMESPSR